MRYTIRQRQQGEILLLVCHVRVVGCYAFEPLRFVNLQDSGQNPSSEPFSVAGQKDSKILNTGTNVISHALSQ